MELHFLLSTVFSVLFCSVFGVLSFLTLCLRIWPVGRSNFFQVCVCAFFAECAPPLISKL